MRSIRPPTLAALFILLTAGAVIATLTLYDPSESAPDGGAAAPAVEAVGSPTAHVAATANAYDRPSRTAEVALVVPTGTRVGAHGRTETGEWLLISSPPGGAARGWVRAAALDLPQDELAAVVSTLNVIPIAEQRTESADDDHALPDLTIADAFLLQTGQLAVSVRNAGQARLPETVISLHVARAEGDILGVLSIGPTELAPGARATVVTPVRITEPGTYRLELDPTDGILEEREGNNSRSVLLIPDVSGGNTADEDSEAHGETDGAADEADDSDA